MGQRIIKDYKSLEAIKNFLNEKEIRIPKDFDDNMFEAASKFMNGKLPPISGIENILRCSQYWKKYCETEKDFQKLILKECYSMARIQCSVVSTIEGMDSYIGNSCKVKVEKLPECTTTIAGYNRASLFEGMGATEEVFPPLR